jgi:hypothetical protein
MKVKSNCLQSLLVLQIRSSSSLMGLFQRIKGRMDQTYPVTSIQDPSDYVSHNDIYLLTS